MSLKLLPSDLDRLASAPQGLDGQYVPQSLLKKGRPLSELQDSLQKDVRAEYFRSLLYSPQVMLNRAYLINTPVIYGDFVKASPTRDTFLKFLEEKWIIPWLYKETTFEEKPAFSVDPVGWEATRGLVGEADIPYLRLSWDERENIEKTNRLSRVFTGYVMRMALVSDEIADSFGIKDEDERKRFSQKLSEVGQYVYTVFDKEKRKFITRDDVYKKFVCVDDTPTVEGKYDQSKEFYRELKILFDLKYNVNLPDSLGIQTLTGYDLPDRATLREVDLLLATGDTKGVELDLSTLFGNIIVGKLGTGMWINSINHLTLEEISKARQTPEFGKFLKVTAELRQTAESVVKESAVPLNFEEYFLAFNNYQKAIANIVEKNYRDEIQPSIEIIIQIGGMILTLLPESNVVKVLGAVASLNDKVAALTAKVIAKGRKGLDIHNASVSRDLLKTSLLDPKGQVNSLLEKIRKSGYKVESQQSIQETEKGTLEEPGANYSQEDYQ